VSTPTVNTMAAGMSCRVPNPVAVDIINRNVDHIVTIPDSEIIEAMRIYFSATHNVAEGAAAAPLAALLQEKKIVRNKRAFGAQPANRRKDVADWLLAGQG
jgi:threonine dehydratase